MGFQVKGKDEMVFIECRCKDCVQSEYRYTTSVPNRVYLCKIFRRLVSGNFYCKNAKRKEADHE